MFKKKCNQQVWKISYPIHMLFDTLYISGPGRKCFVQSVFKLSQDRAEFFCNKSGAHLAKIDSDEEVDLMLG